jgi:hypothetical protein
VTPKKTAASSAITAGRLIAPASCQDGTRVSGREIRKRRGSTKWSTASHEVAREDADPGEPEQVVHDHHAREQQRQREDVPPAVEAVPERHEQVRLERDPAERGDQDEERDDPRAADAEDGARQQRVRLPGPRAEVRAHQRVGDVEPVAEQRDPYGCGEPVAPSWISKPRNMYEKPATNVVQRPAKCHIGRRRSSGTMPVSDVE